MGYNNGERLKVRIEVSGIRNKLMETTLTYGVLVIMGKLVKTVEIISQNGRTVENAKTKWRKDR